MKRRAFLRWGVGGVLLGRAGVAPGREWVPDFSTIDIAATGLTPVQWQVMASVQAHLFPPEPRAPGAQEANATAWLQWVLSDPALPAETRTFFREELGKLMALAQRLEGKDFHRLDEQAKERVLRAHERQGGGHWLREVIHYILEALLSDPVYGGNPDGIGWQWLDHRPGFKRPSPEQRYFLLASR